jgi:hypothetical protein
MGHPFPKKLAITAAAVLAMVPQMRSTAAVDEPPLRLSTQTLFAETLHSPSWSQNLLRTVSAKPSLSDGSGPLSAQLPSSDSTQNSDASPIELPSLNHPDQPAQSQPSTKYVPPHVSFGRGSHASEGWQILPEGLLYRSYLAGDKEPRMQFLSLYDSVSGRQLWDAVLGTRVGLLRNGTVGGDNPQGYQLDLDGAVFARVLPDEPSAMLEGSDYRVGLTGSWREENTSWRLGYSHISSHIGDEFLLAYPTTPRINYVRDSLLAGVSQDLTESLRLYGEIAWAAGASGGAQPLELQAGSEWTPETKSRWSGAPFLAVHGHYREEQGSLIGINTTGGWNWRGQRSGHRLKIGANYYHGPSLQFSFIDRRESLVGGGVWLDF